VTPLSPTSSPPNSLSKSTLSPTTPRNAKKNKLSTVTSLTTDLSPGDSRSTPTAWKKNEKAQDPCASDCPILAARNTSPSTSNWSQGSEREVATDSASRSSTRVMRAKLYHRCIKPILILGNAGDIMSLLTSPLCIKKGMSMERMILSKSRCQ
jgi:hypothetical protein